MYGEKNIGRESPRHFTGGIPLPNEVLPPWTEGKVAGTMVQSHQDLYVLIKQHQVSCTSVCIELLLAYLYI